jgi:acyl-coenzyme A thioesterase 9
VGRRAERREVDGDPRHRRERRHRDDGDAGSARRRAGRVTVTSEVPLRPSDTSREHVLHLSTDLDLRRRFLVLKEPIPGNVRFGLLLEVLDTLAAETAMDYARRALPAARVVTAAVDEIVVRQITDATHDLTCRARVNHVGRSSMEIGIRVESSGAPHLASCYFTMVARDGEGPAARSVPLPPLSPADEIEHARARRAAVRREGYRLEAAATAEPPTREEYLLLAALHRAQEVPGFAGALARDLVAESWERTYPEQENLSKVIFGGYLMRRAFELSSICAERIAAQRPVIAAVNRINFFEPVQIGDKLHFTSRVTYTEGPVISVETAIERISRDRTVRALSNSCLFTFVNVDGALTPQAVPVVHPSHYAEDARYLAARRNLKSLTARTTQRWIARGLGPP